MTRFGRKLMDSWVSYGPAFMPFADVASPDLPLRRLLRLSMFQVSVGMALVLLVGTLNRVMIVELSVPASVVGAMLALPLVFAPFRALIGHRSDTHKCALGWRRVPFIWKGTLLQFGGFAIMPFAILVLAGQGESGSAPAWLGLGSAALSFLLVGAGLHMVQTVGLALATDLTPPQSHARVVGLMYVMLLASMIVSALVFGMALENFSPGRLIQLIQGAAVLTVVLNLLALWKQETRRPPRSQTVHVPDPTFRESWAQFCAGENARRRLLIVGVGTMAFCMSDILLEPFGGQVLNLDVSATTKLTALLAFGGITGFAYASRVLSSGRDPYRVSRQGALIGMPAFVLVMAAIPTSQPILFLIGNFLIGFGGALFGHATLTATMNRAPKNQAGLALGAWGAVQATAAGLAMAVSGIIRDLVSITFGQGTIAGYTVVYSLEIVMLVIVVIAVMPLLRGTQSQHSQPVLKPHA